MSKPKQKLVLFYSGSMMGPSQPERAINKYCDRNPDVMLTYWELHKAWVSGRRSINETLRRLKRTLQQRKAKREQNGKAEKEQN